MKLFIYKKKVLRPKLAEKKGNWVGQKLRMDNDKMGKANGGQRLSISLEGLYAHVPNCVSRIGVIVGILRRRYMSPEGSKRTVDDE